MPFPFELGTTGTVDISTFLKSRTYPALTLSATSKRSALKDALKRHKRLPVKDRSAHLTVIDDALQAYLPYLLALSGASKETVSIDTVRPLQVEWRCTLTSSLPGREAPRPRLTGLHHELAFTLSILASVRSLQARSALRSLHDGSLLTTEQRAAAIVAASKRLLEAHSIYNFLLGIPAVLESTDAPIDTQSSTLSGLASLALAEANLVFVAKDDPYAAAVADDRNENNVDWMYKAPSLPKVRASLYSRICLAAAEHARQAYGLFSASDKLDDSLRKYTNDLRRTARARALRFVAINAEASGSTGEALAWLNAAKQELGLTANIEEGKRKGFRGLKQSWQERREDRKVDKAGDWGMDAGRFEESRIVEMLCAKWDKENSTINVQIVPPHEPLLAQLPSGRDPHTIQPWSAPTLDAVELSTMRSVPDPSELYQGQEDDSGDEEYGGLPQVSIGAYPHDEAHKTTASSYY